jgi:predicted membrane channel-forming protein YqfA (hemolysin III family)
MKRSTGQATLLAYLGIGMIILAYFPGIQERLESVRFFHATWHVLLFVGAACVVYGLETLRSYARRHRRMTQ